MRRLLGIVDRVNYKNYKLRGRRAVADGCSLAFLGRLGVWLRRRDARVHRVQRFRRRCVVSNRARGVFALFRVSGMTFKELVAAGLLPGMRKVGW